MTVLELSPAENLPQPTPPALVAADDSGTKGDGITDDASPSLTGTTQANNAVQLRNSSDTIIATTTADASGNYTVAVPGAPLGPAPIHSRSW